MRDFGVANVASAILDAPENTDAVAKVVECSREAWYKASYTEYLTHVNALSAKKFTDDRCALRGVDTEATLKPAAEAYDGLIVPTLAQIQECLDANDYVDVYALYLSLRKMVKAEAVLILNRMGLCALFLSFLLLHV
ncbi:hypothetical protein Hanom_Chr13g01195661 [Helianthus anomalus]